MNRTIEIAHLDGYQIIERQEKIERDRLVRAGKQNRLLLGFVCTRTVHRSAIYGATFTGPEAITYAP